MSEFFFESVGPLLKVEADAASTEQFCETEDELQRNETHVGRDSLVEIGLLDFEDCDPFDRLFAPPQKLRYV